MYEYLYISTYLSLYTYSIHAYMHTSHVKKNLQIELVIIYIYVYIHMYICICIHKYTHMYLFAYTYMQSRVDVHTPPHTHDVHT